MRGERGFPDEQHDQTYGSSPRARGTRRRADHGHTRKWFIPACAGNAELSNGSSVQRSVHPRVRGEREPGSRQVDSGIGSSPRARGTRPLLIEGIWINRFIPACAGNAPMSASPRPGGPVHPRVRGERIAHRTGIVPPNGSSPRARGTLDQQAGQAAICRFIPACAGNAWRPWCRPLIGPVHPRVRGERLEEAHSTRPPPGSSPRARGTRPRFRRQFPPRRFIPACAGNARLCAARTPERPVHPRVRGERARRSRYSSKASGSSPRARGTR